MMHTNGIQAPGVTWMSRASNSRWGILQHMNEAGTDKMYGGQRQNKIGGVHVHHVGIAIHT